jgi:hypothetical protein
MEGLGVRGDIAPTHSSHQIDLNLKILRSDFVIYILRLVVIIIIIIFSSNPHALGPIAFYGRSYASVCTMPPSILVYRESRMGTDS